MGSSLRIGAIIAARTEAEAVLAEPRFRWREEGPRAWASGRFPLRLVFSGVGKVLASWAWAALAPGSDLLVSLGTAGGLGGERLGSLWLVPEFVEHDMDLSGLGLPPGVTPSEGMEGPVLRSARPGALALARRALAAAGLEAGECRMASGDSFIADGSAARELAARSGARLVDMESAAVAKLCALRAGRSLDYFSLRSVSDNADHEAAGSWEEEARRASAVFSAFLLALALENEGGGSGPGLEAP